MSDLQQILDELRKPFHPSNVSWKPGAVKGDRALAMPYADLRAYMARLDEVSPDWTVEYEPWGQDRIICKLSIGGISRSSTGESSSESERSEIGGTSAEAQAFKRASAMFGLGRYLYTMPSMWVDYDAKGREFTAQAKAKLTAMLTQHYRRATESTGTADKPQPGPAAQATEANPFDDTTLTGQAPYYLHAWNQLTGKPYDLVKWIRALHVKSDGPCTAKQYQYLTGVVDALTAKEHNYALSVLCQAEISKANMPGAKAADALLSVLPATKTDADGNEYDNPEYRADMAEMVTQIAKAAPVAATNGKVAA